MIGVDPPFVGQQVTVGQMHLLSQEGTYSQEFAAFAVASFVVVLVVALFEVVVSVNVATVEEFLALELKPGVFHLTTVDGFDLAFAYLLVFAS